MSEAIGDSSEQQRPTASRTNSENLRARPVNNRSTSIDISRRDIVPDDSMPINLKGDAAASNPLQEPKAKKKPRKLAIRNTQASITPSLPSDKKSIDLETREKSLDIRVSALESEYRKLHKRTNSNTIEIGKLQASTRTAPDISIEDRAQDKTQSSSEEKEVEQVQIESASPPADHYRNPCSTDLNRVEELSDEEMEIVPRSTAPAVGELPEQNRSVALKGSYKIPLPSNLSTDDVRAVQSGLAAASTVAREIATAMRGGRLRKDSAVNEAGQDKRGTASTKSTTITNVDLHEDVSSPRSWTSLLNSCTKLVSNAANAIEMEAAAPNEDKFCYLEIGRAKADDPPFQTKCTSSIIRNGSNSVFGEQEFN
ncbi:hypothetical protein EG327_006802 [Venturia inaequalis]|uniref:Uncharacterized protein n=1 Tax=Venturia inaequalis TaxID=5025 RepID=A0A8H3VQ99_VENIN|nr:hypothetical protein EG327_006802 [Venturia inaequalis]